MERAFASICSGQNARLHILDDIAAEFAGLDLLGPFHEALEIVGHLLLLDRALHALFDQIGGFVPAEEPEHHDTRQNNGAWIDHILVGVLGGGAVSSFEDRITIADVSAGGNAEPSHLRRAGVGNVIAVQVGRCQHRVLVSAGYDLLEDGIGDAVVDHQLLFPRSIAVSLVDGIEDIFHFLVNRIAEFRRAELQARLDQVCILLDCNIGILVLVVENPALALGNDLVAKFLRGQFVAPLAKSALGELLDVALVNQGYTLAAVLERELNGHANQALGSGHRYRFDANTRIEANLLLPALQHVFVEEFDQLGGLRCSLLPLDTGVNVLSVLPENDDIHALRMLYRRGHAAVVLHRANAGIEIEDLSQRDIQGANAASHRGCERSFNRDAKFANRIDAVVRQPVVELGFGFLSGKHLVPGYVALAVVGLLDG